MHEARALQRRFLELAERQQDALILAVGHWMLAYTAWWQGDFVDVRNHSRQVLALYNPSSTAQVLCAYDQDPASFADTSCARNWVLGYPTQAVQAMENGRWRTP